MKVKMMSLMVSFALIFTLLATPSFAWTGKVSDFTMSYVEFDNGVAYIWGRAPQHTRDVRLIMESTHTNFNQMLSMVLTGYSLGQTMQFIIVNDKVNGVRLKAQ